MAPEGYPRKDVERSFRKFKDRVDDVSIATFGTWDNAFTHLMNHCERDPIMGVVIGPLRKRMAAEASHWLETTHPSDTFMLPEDDEGRLAMLYQLMLAVYRDETNLLNLSMTIDYGTDSHDLPTLVNDQIIRPFTREVSYLLDDILENTQGDEQVSTEALLVFTYHDNSQTIHAGPGSIIATRSASISGSKATYNYKAELGPRLSQGSHGRRRGGSARGCRGVDRPTDKGRRGQHRPSGRRRRRFRDNRRGVCEVEKCPS